MNDGLDVLLIEDDLDAQSNLCDILEMDEHRVTVACSAADGRRLAAEASFAAIVLDRKLPDSTAEELLPELRQLQSDADIVVVTGYADLTSTITALRYGVSDYIIKPINADSLRNCLDKISNRRRVENELQSEQRFANQILDTAEAIVLVLDLDANIVRHNACLTRVTGWTLRETMGENWFALFIPEEDHDRVREAFRKTASEGHSEGIVNRIITKDRRERHIRWSNSVMKDDEGNVSAVLAVGVDITDQIEAQQKIMQSQRLAAIGETMTGLAHESRNALQRIQASLDMLQLELADNVEVQPDLKAIRRASDDIKTLLEEVKAFAAPIHLQTQTANLAEIWRSAWKSIRPAWSQRDVVFGEILHGEDLSVKVDSMRIEQVFRNLFENSLAACTDPTKISVRCSFADENEVEIVVTDNGPGLSVEAHDKIFEAFFTTKSTGTGLGMSIVQRIVESHEGKVWVGTTTEPGASFVIRLLRNPKTNFET